MAVVVAAGLKDERVAAEAVYANIGVPAPTAGEASVDKQQLIADVAAALFASKVSRRRAAAADLRLPSLPARCLPSLPRQNVAGTGP